MTVSEFIKKIVEDGLEYFGLYYSCYEGIVTDNQDPDKRGRLKLQCPSVYGESESEWALPRGVFSGNKIGFFALPQKGDPVWVTFKRGDVKVPIWEYGCFANGYAPDGADFEHFIFRTPKGYTLTFDEKDEAVTLKKSDTDYICIKEKISIYANGENLFTQIDKLLVTLLKPQNIMTSSGPGQFNPDTIQALTEVKTSIGKLLE